MRQVGILPTSLLSLPLPTPFPPPHPLPPSPLPTPPHPAPPLAPLQDVVVLNAFGVVVNALGTRVKPYLPQICGTILWRLNNKAAKVRQQAADLISRIANVMMQCGEVRSGGAVVGTGCSVCVCVCVCTQRMVLGHSPGPASSLHNVCDMPFPS